MAIALNALHQGDCVKKLAQVEPGSIDLVFADPPFNIGYKYDVYDDRRQADDYLAWSKEWMQGVHTALKPDGTFWLAIGDDFAAELKVLAQRELGFHCRSWVIWYYTFGVNCKYKFTRSHTHLFHFVKDRKKFTFNFADPAIRVPSARQIVYADDRANEKGRLPDDTWILRPQDIPEAFTPQEDVWYFARVAGTFKERAGFHGCQMPERLLARIILACSREGETVLDPFSGSGTTLIVAKKLNRNYVGFELSKDYVGKVRERLSQVNVGDELEGPADPRRSAPSTGQGKRLAEKCITNTKQLPRQNVKGTSSETASQTRTIKSATLTPVRSITEDSIELRRRGIIEAFRKSCQGYSVDRVVADPELNREFLHKCNVLGIAGNPAVWNRQLFGLRKAGALKGLSTKRAIVLPTNMADQFSFASEIAWFDLAKEHGCTLDDILCDPALADQFDKYAHRLAPGFKPFHYRWAALQMRKQAKKAKEGVESFQIENSWKGMNLSNLNLDRLAGVNGAYLLRNANRKAIYVGMANDLRSVFDILQESLVADGWKDREPELVKIYPTSVSVGERMKTKASIIYREKPQIDILFSGEKI